MGLVEKITFVFPNRWVPAPPGQLGGSLFVGIGCVHASPEYYLHLYRQVLEQQSIFTVQEIVEKLDKTTYAEIQYAPGIPFVIDPDMPAGKARFVLIGENN